MPWLNIRGHDALVDNFRKLLEANRLPHAMLFVGPPSVGKTTFARAFAQGLLCEKHLPQELANRPPIFGSCPGFRSWRAGPGSGGGGSGEDSFPANPGGAALTPGPPPGPPPSPPPPPP